MRTITLEIRDRMTCIPALAIVMVPTDEAEGYYLRRVGFAIKDASHIVLMKLNDQAAHSDIYDWADRTMMNAHQYVIDHFHELKNGDVVDVRVILGETTEPAKSERLDRV